jgi:PAS domain S-box-containing protein
MFLALQSASAGTTHRVLLLFSSGREYAPYNALSAIFRTRLAEHSPLPLEFIESSLEFSLSDSNIAEKTLIPYLRTLTEDRQLDLVVTFGAPAAQFALRHRELFSPSTMRLYSNLDVRFLENVSLEANEVAVPLQIDLSVLVGNIFQALPDTKQVTVIFGKDPLALFWTNAFKREVDHMRGRVTFTYWNDLSFLKMREKAATLPPNSAIFFGVMGLDAAGITYDRAQAITGIDAVTKAPIFGVFDSDLGHCVVGGRLIMIQEIGLKSAEVGSAILRGEKVQKMNLLPTMGKPAYDWRELEHWQIPLTRLPANSEVLYRPPSFWVLYRWPVIVVAAFLALQTLMIFSLLWNRRLLRRSQAELAEHDTQLNLATESAGAGLWIMELPSRQIKVTAKGRELFSFKVDQELHFDDYMKSICPEDREMVCQEVEQAIQGGRPFDKEYRILRPDGNIRWIASRGKLQPGNSGKPSRLMGTSIDVTERKLAELNLRGNEKLLRQNETDLRRLAETLLSSQEKERARISRELHDDFTQRLAVLSIETGKLEGQFQDVSEPVRQKLADLKSQLIALSRDIHDLSRQLHPSILDDLGLVRALESECAVVSKREGVEVLFSPGQVPEDYDKEISLALYRIVQESLTNIAKYACADQVSVSLQGVAGEILLSIQDNGVGFDPGEVRGKHGLGFMSMRERMRLIGGEVLINSQPGMGTLITAKAPFRSPIEQHGAGSVARE